MNDAGIKLVKDFEGCKLTAYLCPAGVPTIGYGHTGPDVSASDVGQLTITQEQADQMLLEDLYVVEARLKRNLLIEPNANELGAMVSLAYNIGMGNLKSSTLLRLWNAGADKAQVAGEFPRWNKAGGRVLPGLIARRAAERDLFLTPVED